MTISQRRPRPGINVPGDGSIPASRLIQFLPRGSIIRFVLYPSVPQAVYLRDLRIHGFLPLLVVANESFDRGDGSRYSYAELVHFINDRYQDLPWGIQVGNEWDHRSGSSWTMTEADLDALLWTFWNAKHGGIDGTTLRWLLVLGGSVSGDPNALQIPDEGAYDVVAVHPYGQRPWEGWNPGVPWGFGNVGELLQRYREMRPTKPILVSEYGMRARDFGEGVQAAYHVDMAAVLSGIPYVLGYIPFAAHDEEGYGILSRKAEIAIRNTFRDLYKEDPVMPKYVLGFKELADRLGQDVVGEPLENQDYLPLANGGEIAFQTTSKGFMYYSKKANKAMFIKGQS